MTSKYKEIRHSDNSDNEYRGITYLGTLADKFAVSWCGTYSQWDTLEAAVARVRFLESPEGRQDRIQREERQRIKLEYDLAREQRREQHSIARQFEHADDAADTVVFA